jgi:FtsH-binding integral membrane protein
MPQIALKKFLQLLKKGIIMYSVSTYSGAHYDEGLRSYMLQVYNYMTVALALSGLVSLGVSMSPALMSIIWATPFKWVVVFAPLAMSLIFAFTIEKINSSTAKMFLFAFAVAMGLSLSSIFAIYKMGSIIHVFFISAATFGAASIYGYTTKADLTKMGSFLIMGAIGLIIAGIVNIFLQSSAFAFAISCLAVLIFTGLTAYDTQQIKQFYDDIYENEDDRQKMGVFGALMLYMDFINIFVHLLQLIGDKKD